MCVHRTVFKYTHTHTYSPEGLNGQKNTRPFPSFSEKGGCRSWPGGRGCSPLCSLGLISLPFRVSICIHVSAGVACTPSSGSSPRLALWAPPLDSQVRLSKKKRVAPLPSVTAPQVAWLLPSLSLTEKTACLCYAVWDTCTPGGSLVEVLEEPQQFSRKAVSSLTFVVRTPCPWLWSGPGVQDDGSEGDGQRGGQGVVRGAGRHHYHPQLPLRGGVPPPFLWGFYAFAIPSCTNE